MPIKTEDPQALEKLDKKLKACIGLQELMKEVNTIIRSKRSDEEKRSLIMTKFNISAEKVAELLHPEQSWLQPGFQSYELSNNNAEIRRLKGRIAKVAAYQKDAAAAEETGELPEFSFNGGKIVDNIPENRLQIFFDAKPEADIRTKLKQHGFRWAPGNSAWQSYRNPRTLEWAKREFNAAGAECAAE